MGSVANCVTRSALTQVQGGCFRAPRIGQKAHSAGLMRVACNATARKKKAETAESTAGQSGDLVFAAGEKVVGHEIPPEVEAIGEGEKSIARIGYTAECEAAVNEQISIEYSISYIYHSMYSYFDRDTVALPGLAKFFQISSEEERSHAQKLMDFQNMRGGRVKLDALSAPQTDFSHDTKGDALFAMELVLSLEKLNFSKLRILHDVAAAANDAQMCDFIEGSLLEEQAADVKKAAEYVTQLRRVGKGHGAYHWDKELAEKLA